MFASLVAAVCLFAMVPMAFACVRPTDTPRAWQRSLILPPGQTIHLALITLLDTKIDYARVRIRGRRVTITLMQRPVTAPSSEVGLLRCVAIRLRTHRRWREVIEGTSGQAPDHAKPGSSLANQRDDTLSLDLQGHCPRVPVSYGR